MGRRKTRIPRAELVRRLLEYEQIRDVSQRLASAEAERARRFGKGFLEQRPRPPMEETPLETTWDEVFGAALLVTPPDPRIRTHIMTTRPVAMEDKMNLILSTLDRVRRIEFSRLVRPFKSRTHSVMTLLAGLGAYTEAACEAATGEGVLGVVDVSGSRAGRGLGREAQWGARSGGAAK